MAETKTETKTEEKTEVKTETAETEAVPAIPNARWYAIRTITGHEKRVKSYLDSEIPILVLENKIAQFLIPEEKVFEVKGGKKKIKYKNSRMIFFIFELPFYKLKLISHVTRKSKRTNKKQKGIYQEHERKAFRKKK